MEGGRRKSGVRKESPRVHFKKNAPQAKQIKSKKNNNRRRGEGKRKKERRNHV